MAGVPEFIRQHLAAIQAMEALRRSMAGPLEAAARLAVPRDILSEVRIHAAMREALAKNRAVTSPLSGIAPLALPAFRATEAIAGLLEATRPIREHAAEMARMQAGWRELLAPMSPDLRPFPALESHLAGLARIAETSRMLAAMLPADRIGHAFALPLELRTGLVAGFEELTGAYGDFYQSVGEAENRVLALPPVATAGPASEYFNAVDLLETTTDEEVEPEAEEEIQAVRDQIAEQNAAALSGSLSVKFPDLVGLLGGARAAFASRHDDYQRHFITSLRELFTHVLHRLAPDDEVRKFSTDREDFPDNRPTRNVRLRYICRGINDRRFGKFVEKDVAAMLALVDLFQGGTHAVTCSYTEPQLRALLVRAEGLVQFLLEVGECE